MSHLTEEQFEDLLRDTTHIPRHVDGCPLCRARFDETYALVQRVRQASLSIQAPPVLADRIRAGVAALAESAATAPGRVRLLPLRIRRPLWSGLAAAAALLVLAIPIGFYVSTGSPANAAPVALEEIHHANLESLGQLVHNDDPGAVCAYLENQVHHSPILLSTESGLSLCGCCVRQFQGRPVASYVVKRHDIPISVIAVPQPPEELGMTLTEHKVAAQRDIWQARHRCCNLAAVRIGAYSYCAVGQVPPEELVLLLNGLPAPAEDLDEP
jgi:anti-sigma factor RsiW